MGNSADDFDDKSQHCRRLLLRGSMRVHSECTLMDIVQTFMPCVSILIGGYLLLLLSFV